MRISITIVELALNISAFAKKKKNIKLNKLYSLPFSIIKHQLKLIGVHGTLPIGTQFLALKVIRPEHASAIIEALATGIGVVVVPPRRQSIVTNVVMEMGDVITAARTVMVPTTASVTMATNSGKATSNDVTVSFTYFLFNLVIFLIIQLQYS